MFNWIKSIIGGSPSKKALKESEIMNYRQRRGEFWHTKEQWQAINKIIADKADGGIEITINVRGKS